MYTHYFAISVERCFKIIFFQLQNNGRTKRTSDKGSVKKDEGN